jgi:plasmid stabilization system protein ParE
MKRMVFSSVFEADFAEITAQLAAEASLDVSIRWEKAIIRLVGLLQKHPELGRVRRDFHPAGIRTFRVKEFPNFLHFYRTTADEIIFLRVRFGGMDLTTMFPND